MTKILGVDPGAVHGGLAIIELVNGALPVLVDVIDIPVVGTGAKQRVDGLALHEWLAVHRPHKALIERAQAMPKQGASSGFQVWSRRRRFGRYRICLPNTFGDNRADQVEKASQPERKG